MVEHNFRRFDYEKQFQLIDSQEFDNLSYCYVHGINLFQIWYMMPKVRD